MNWNINIITKGKETLKAWTNKATKQQHGMINQRSSDSKKDFGIDWTMWPWSRLNNGISLTSWVVQARGPAKVRSFPLIFSFRNATSVSRAISYWHVKFLDSNWKKKINRFSWLQEINYRSNCEILTWVSMYAILVGASVPHTDFSSRIGTAYCPIRPWLN